MHENQADTAIPHILRALENLLKAWDAIADAERIVGFEITTSELSDLAAGIDRFEDVRRLMTPQHIFEWLDEIEVSAK